MASSQDFKLVVDIDSCRANTKVKLYAVKRYDQITNLRVKDFIASGNRAANVNRWELTGTLNDSTTLYRLHIGNYNNKKIHSYARTTTFVSLTKGDSIHLRLPNSSEFFTYKVYNSPKNEAIQRAFDVNYSLWHINEIIDTVASFKRKELIREKTFLLEKKTKMLDTISKSDAFFVLINPEINTHLKNLLFFKNNEPFSNKIWNEFSSSLQAKQLIYDIELIKPDKPSYGYIILPLIILLTLYVILRKKFKKNYLMLLSPNERIIIEMISEGKTNKEIAESKFTQVSTVKKQVSSIYKKLKVKNRTEALNYYNQHRN